MAVTRSPDSIFWGREICTWEKSSFCAASLLGLFSSVSDGVAGVFGGVSYAGRGNVNEPPPVIGPEYEEAGWDEEEEGYEWAVVEVVAERDDESVNVIFTLAEEPDEPLHLKVTVKMSVLEELE